MKPLLKLVCGVFALLGLMSSSAFAAPAAVVADPAALLAGIDFATTVTVILGIAAAGIVFYLGKGAGIQVMMFVRRILGA